MPKKGEWKNPARLWRQQRLQELLDMIREHKNAKISEIVAKLSLEYGLSERKVKEYLKVLEAEGKIAVNWFDDVVQIK
jgi:DeoR/GlpR family transcriptional regulator of sugar metabolism